MLRLVSEEKKKSQKRKYSIRERTLHIVEFGHVGKLSKAHDLAAKVGSKKVKPDKILSLEEILELVLEIKPQKKTEVEKRLKDT